MQGVKEVLWYTHTHDETLVIVKSTTYSCVGKTRGHDAKWNKPDTGRKKTCIISFTCEFLVIYIRLKSRTVVTMGEKVGEMGRCWSNGAKLQLCRMNKSRDLRYSMTTIVNNAILSTRNLLRVDFRCFHYTHAKVTVWDDMLISLTVVIISLCIGLSNHVVYLKYVLFFVLKNFK